MACAVVRVH